MKNLIVFLVLFFCKVIYSQAPFTTAVKEPIYLEKIKDNGKSYFRALETVPIDTLTSETYEVGSIKTSEKKEVDFFKNNNLSLTLVDDTDNRMSVKSEVLHYKIYIASPSEDNTSAVNRYNLPLLVITKLSTSYDSINAASSLDVLDYEAAPLTIRVMPSFKIDFDNYNDVFYYGFYADIRGINMYIPSQDDHEIEFIGSGGVGFTYQGDGMAGSYNTNGEYFEGKYSFSAILQGATGKNEVISSLFKTNKDYIGAMQLFFVMKMDKQTQLNLKVGFQYLFEDTIAGNRTNFTVALGI